ncbi:putative bifunctional diguanylate cyclase/phosphodiesterase [Novosphingobium taihuense]|uniref:Diguanylate cyclase (GGDEF)-like protein n=1 Tax=Novosphingobium taihuense TaxID=260085 RepID=A0A7W7EU97_9SPHN|nr:EAL domain-containing protein [Novosphingobium taihuense]MBB4614072.1 diguanylate cyclase (GGDEF)-like protein [Novosphingobium taihuense]TWH86922.1 diguanylate cyclase/phosphodiesterase [Novosphingobium taihuense]
MRRTRDFFKLDTSDAELSRAQFRSFSVHMPLLYAILVCNAVAITVSFFDANLLFKTFVTPLFICSIAIWRAVWWWRQSDPARLTDAQIDSYLKRTCNLAVIMTVAFEAWCMWVFQDGSGYTRANLTFFLALTEVSTVFCLMTLRAAAMRVALVSTASFVFYFSWVDDWQMLSQSIVLCIVAVGMVVVTHRYNLSFSALIRSQRHLRIRQRETEKLSEENRRIAFSDPLSGLPNRRELLTRLDRLEARSDLAYDTLALIFIDLDGFKAVNDEHGHQAGDALIRSICIRLNQHCPLEARLARIGGDEFAVVVDAPGAEARALTLAATLLEEVSLPVVVERHVLQVGASIGIASNTDDSANPRELLRRADTAMYHAKTQGKGQIAVYNPTFDEGRLHRLAVEAQIGRGLSSGEFEVHYQPEVDAKTGEVVAVEALLRWPRRLEGPLPPDEFIEIAEATGQIHPLGMFVLERACRDIAPLGNLRLSVNVSPAQFRDAHFERQVAHVLEQTQFPPHRLQFEITEGYLLANPERVVRAVETFKSRGLSIALDDFGTGFTSIHYLRSYGFSHIKIDKSLLIGLSPGSKAAMLVSGAIMLACGLDMRVIAEGVETDEQADLLRKAGCHKLQGFLFGKPMPLDEFVAHLARSRRALGESPVRIAS